MVIGTTILLVVVNLLIGTVYVYFQWRLDQINRVPVAGLADDVVGEVMNVLLVGSDSRERLTGQDAAQAGKDEVSGQRSDTIMVLHVDPRQRRASILAVPRDLYVPIPGTNGSDRVNAAFTIGGAERLIGALSGIGVQVNHYAEVDFVGFKEIVDAMGGVSVLLPNWVRDFSSGLDVPRSGCVDLNGTEALAYVRSRQFESLIDGKWVTDPRGDLGRIERQQDFIRRVMKKGVSAGISNPLALNRLIGIGVRNLTLDDTMSTSDITNVARHFRTVDPDSVETLVLPTTPQMIDGKSVLILQDQEAQDEIAKINGAAPVATTTPVAPPASTGGPATTSVPGGAPADAVPFKPAELRVRILNGTGTKGLAAKVADGLKAGGLTVVGTGNAEPSRRTVLRYAEGEKIKAQALLGGLVGGGELREDRTLTGADVALVLGADFQGFKDPTKPSPPTAPPANGEDPAAQRIC